MPARVLMVQGTASSVGKSIMVAALCRIFKQDGHRVAPFKSQNMALNSFVTKEGGEIGRAQAAQAEAACVESSIHMNPILLKPEADTRSQVIVLGKVSRNLSASEYYQYTPRLLQIIRDSLEKLRSSHDIVVIEGAGSPAEINFRDREIVNMRVAFMAKAPVLLVGDIDRGGVFASLVGTLQLLTRQERSTVKGLIINKFRGDIELLKPGLGMLEKLAKKPVLGVIPFYRGITIAHEDSVYFDEEHASSVSNKLQVAVIYLPHISNFDDFDPFKDLGCSVNYISHPAQLNDPDLIILPGTKTTISDLSYLQKCGLAKAIIEKGKSGTPIVGICGGYQMMGKSIADPQQVESQETFAEGLGLLDNETVFSGVKTTTQVKAEIISDLGLLQGMNGIEVSGYEIHMGQTSSQKHPPAFKIVPTSGEEKEYYDGAINSDGLFWGTYIHGIFHNLDFTKAFLSRLQKIRGLPEVLTNSLSKDEQYDKLAEVVRQNLDMKKIYEIMSDKKGVK
jgi:adenosylcobyric acid synthase